MSSIVLYPANGYDFDAADVAAYNAPRTSGVYSSDEDFVVTAAGGMDVTVSAGLGWVRPERFAGYSIVKRDPDTITLPLADGSRPRIDRIVLRYDAAARKASLQVLTGDASSTPTAPAITRTALVYDLCLAEVSRPAGSTAVTAANLTDTRLDEDLCGVMSDGVTRLPTAQLLAQARAVINALEETASQSAEEAAGSAGKAAGSESAAGASAKNAAASEAAALLAAEDAAGSASAAKTDSETAAAKATAADTSAKDAAASKTAAGQSAEDAAAAQAKAEAAAALAGTRAGTDKTLNIEDAPADAKATGDALDKKADKDVILDEDGNVLFYSKTAVDELLAKKLDLTGGTMSGELTFGNGAGRIYASPNDAAYGPYENLSNLVIESWNGVSFAAADSHQVFYKKTAVGIDCRNSIVKAQRFEGAADNGVVASGSGYVRFGDGTQICTVEFAISNIAQGGKYNGTATFPVPFSSVPTISLGSVWGWGEDAFLVGLSSNDCEIRVLNCSSNSHSRHLIAIGRWK